MQGRRAAQAAAVSRVSLRKQEGNFEELPTELASPPAPQNLKFERPDWSLFRTVEGLQQKAGVAKSKLRRLVLKELVDNGLDEDAKVRVGVLQGGGYFVEDDGRGIDGTPEEIAQLFSIARPMVSTKLLRLPTRGALGNGLRVVAGAVLASLARRHHLQSPDGVSARARRHDDDCERSASGASRRHPD